MQFQLGQGLAAGEFVVADDEIALPVIGPARVFGRGERGRGDADQGSGKEGADETSRRPPDQGAVSRYTRAAVPL